MAAALVAGALSCRAGEVHPTTAVACRGHERDTVASVFLEDGTSPSDSLTSVRLCLATARASLGSYHVAIEYDTSAVALVAAVPAPNGAQAVNPNTAGVVQVAGANPHGFVDGPLATLSFHARRRGQMGDLKLTLAELTSAAGSDVRSVTRVAGLPATDARLGVVGAVETVRVAANAPARAGVSPVSSRRRPTLTWIAPTPRIDSLVPASTATPGDAVVEVVVHGDGFTTKGNTVLFGPVEIGPVASENGRVLRFVVPASMPSRGEVPPMQLGPGEYPVRVRNANGVSNTKLFTKRG